MKLKNSLEKLVYTTAAAGVLLTADALKSKTAKIDKGTNNSIAQFKGTDAGSSEEGGDVVLTQNKTTSKDTEVPIDWTRLAGELRNMGFKANEVVVYNIKSGLTQLGYKVDETLIKDFVRYALTLNIKNADTALKELQQKWDAYQTWEEELTKMREQKPNMKQLELEQMVLDLGWWGKVKPQKPTFPIPPEMVKEKPKVGKKK